MKNDREKLLGCWLGKTVGGILGAPYEGYPHMNNLTFYDPVPKGSEPNDDVELQVMYAAALAKMEKPEINRGTLSDIWIAHMEYNADEYTVALCNLRRGIRPPWCGSYDNYYIDGMGAAIRSELWACLAPGNPELAAKFAYEDACIDHAGAGIDAEIVLAALESLAFVESDLETLLDRSFAFLPDESELKASMVETRRLWRESGDWKAVRNQLFERYADEFKTNVRINLPFTVLALLASGGDFGKGICIAANCGMDTDCTAASVGAILGILNPAGVTAEWLAPIGRDLVVRPEKIVNIETPKTIDALVDLIEELRARVRLEVVVPHFEEPDWSKHAVKAEIAFHENIHWYHIDQNKLDWKPIELSGLYAGVDLPENRGALQVVVRFRFKIEKRDRYTLIFNSPASNQVYLDPAPGQTSLHDDRDMLFGRMRPYDGPLPERRFRNTERPVIFSPCLGGAPLNQYKRHLVLEPGEHVLVAALSPRIGDQRVYWGMGVGPVSTGAFLPGAFRD